MGWDPSIDLGEALGLRILFLILMNQGYGHPDRRAGRYPPVSVHEVLVLGDTSTATSYIGSQALPIMKRKNSFMTGSESTMIHCGGLDRMKGPKKRMNLVVRHRCNIHGNLD